MSKNIIYVPQVTEHDLTIDAIYEYLKIHHKNCTNRFNIADIKVTTWGSQECVVQYKLIHVLESFPNEVDYRYISFMEHSVERAWTMIGPMAELGYELVKEDENGITATFQNKGGVESTFYGKMGRGKRIIKFNRNWSPTHVFVEIQEDAGTRRVFHGGCANQQDFIKVLELVY